MTGFIPHTVDEQAAMLAKIGVKTVDDLFSAIPTDLRQVWPCNTLPEDGRDELSLQQFLTQHAAQNTGSSFESFQGGGAYHRFIPPAVNNIASRSEFYTAYTPYQPEVSQGTLQMVYEFQTMMSELTGMDVTNASVYDGVMAPTEAVYMALRATRRAVVYVSNTLHPQTIEILETYLTALGNVHWQLFDPHQPFEAQVQHEPKQIAAILTQQPDYMGSIHTLEPLRTFKNQAGALLIVSVDPVTLALLEAPQTAGADIVCGDIQPFGNPVNYGGPYGGFISCTQKLMRQLPGRLVGCSVDKHGKKAYTLTLQTREQHIRRDKATSNICTNQSLNVLKATVYLSLVGPQGLQQIASVSTQRAHQLAEGLCQLAGITLRYPETPFLYEFAVRLPIPASQLIRTMSLQDGIIPGIDLGKYYPDEGNTLLVTVTEMNSTESIERYLKSCEKAIRHHGLSVISGNPLEGTRMIATGTRGEDERHG